MQIEIPLNESVIKERGVKLSKAVELLKENFKDLNIKLLKEIKGQFPKLAKKFPKLFNLIKKI